jgi:hypothetical protein
MSKVNVFQVNPIFYMPIDFDESKKVDNSNNDDSASELDLSSSIEEDEDDEDENTNIITFSLIKNNRNLKSKTNSSKIYISEIFKKNWKIKARRLMAKIKKKLIKQWKNAQSNNSPNNMIDNNTNFTNNIIIKSNNINKNFDFNNYYIKKINSIENKNNRILANLLCNNNCLANNNSNIYKNIKYNCNNYNNNNLTFFNSLINNYNNNTINIGY